MPEEGTCGELGVNAVRSLFSRPSATLVSGVQRYEQLGRELLEHFPVIQLGEIHH